MRRSFIIIILVTVSLAIGWKTFSVKASQEKRKDLYVTVMEHAFNEENGGNAFIAIDLTSLEGLSKQYKKEILIHLSHLAPHVYPLSSISKDRSKFVYDKKLGGNIRTVNGTVLSVHVQEYSEKKAVITGESWFSARGSVFPKYEATYKDGEWKLHLKRKFMG